MLACFCFLVCFFVLLHGKANYKRPLCSIFYCMSVFFVFRCRPHLGRLTGMSVAHCQAHPPRKLQGRGNRDQHARYPLLWNNCLDALVEVLLALAQFSGDGRNAVLEVTFNLRMNTCTRFPSLASCTLCRVLHTFPANVTAELAFDIAPKLSRTLLSPY